MPNIRDLVDGLMNSDANQAYQCLKQLEDISSHSAEVYPFFDIFVEMLDNTNSYIRTRGIVLIAANAKWDVDYRVDEIIDKYLKYIMDDKPITARQCIKALPSIVKYKPDLKDDIINALRRADPSRYKESMQTLILRDVQRSLSDIRDL